MGNINRIILLVFTFIALSFIELHSQIVISTFPESGLTFEWMVAKKDRNKIFLYDTYKAADIPPMRKITKQFYADLYKDIINKHDSIELGFRVFKSSHQILEKKYNIVNYDTNCIQILYSKSNDSLVIIEKFDYLNDVLVFIAHKKRKNQYKIFSEVGTTSGCGKISFTIPLYKNCIIVFYKKGYQYSDVIRFKKMDP